MNLNRPKKTMTPRVSFDLHQFVEPCDLNLSKTRVHGFLPFGSVGRKSRSRLLEVKTTTVVKTYGETQSV